MRATGPAVVFILCTETRDHPPARLAKTLEADQMKTIAFPGGPASPVNK